MNGMSVTNPLKEDVKYINGEFKKEALDFQARIEKENKKAFQSYAWGVWITAHTRYKLERALNIVGTGYVYCDTDSVKFIGRPRFKQFNEELTDKALKAGAYAKDPKGNIHYIGVFEREDSYSQFKTLGAKRYAYTYKDGTNGITIAGVNKKIGAEELWDLGGLEAFKDGVTFYRAGGTEVVYNDKVNKMIELDGRPFRLTDNACIKDSTYTLGMTGEYLRIINHPDLWLRVFDDLD